ncbi:hypothetical protein [Faecalimicrobium dakarense]|uniref:hypothetical protein n=1 Tax=Faecalimicrobium dakarense TaxID=1301100 RepID=UPI0004B4DBBD|nr:hypothetical protein [[Clostridium] dakarense]
MGLFNQCSKCDKKGIFLKLIDGLCKDCNHVKQNEFEEKRKIEEIKEQIRLNEVEEKRKLKDYEESLIKRKNELYGDIERNAHNIKEVIDEYKDILNKLGETSCSEDENIKILIDEINEKEPYILILNEMQHLIWQLNNPEYCLPSSLVENVEKLESIYLPKIKEMEQKI